MTIANVVAFGSNQLFYHWIYTQIAQIGNQLRMFRNENRIIDFPK